MRGSGVLINEITWKLKPYIWHKFFKHTFTNCCGTYAGVMHVTDNLIIQYQYWQFTKWCYLIIMRDAPDSSDWLDVLVCEEIIALNESQAEWTDNTSLIVVAAPCSGVATVDYPIFIFWIYVRCISWCNTHHFIKAWDLHWELSSLWLHRFPELYSNGDGSVGSCCWITKEHLDPYIN